MLTILRHEHDHDQVCTITVKGECLRPYLPRDTEPLPESPPLRAAILKAFDNPSISNIEAVALAGAALADQLRRER